MGVTNGCNTALTQNARTQHFQGVQPPRFPQAGNVSLTRQGGRDASVSAMLRIFFDFSG